MELRHRPAADAGTAVETPTAAERGRAGRNVSEERRDRPAESGRAPDSADHSSSADARPTGDNARRYDADAEFKRGVPRPPGQLPDEAVRREPRSAVPRITEPRAAATRLHEERSGAAWPPELHHDERAANEVSGPRERFGTDAGDASRPAGADSDQAPRARVDQPAIHDPISRNSPSRYVDLLAAPDGTRMPCFNGPPRREQAAQGRTRDCGVIATLGSVAHHRPDELTSRVRLKPDGTYTVMLSEAERTETGAKPTGRMIELTVTPEVPIHERRPDIPAGAAVTDGAAWCPVVEKALAGVDETWTLPRRVAWLDTWVEICRDASAANPDAPIREPAPMGYARLNQGSDAWDRAEMLTQLTGQPAEVRYFPSGDEEWKINRVIREQLQAGKPVLVASRDRADDQEMLPHKLDSGHVYEVTGVDQGKIVLRNPWNHTHPEPMETDEFAANMRPCYTTLT